ncbi:MAG: hypothetical protein K0U72_02970 [Gammaproteobacteria bacterium]|nr:hypothetical protein [Gammaproteobacteria bacterium]
MNDDQAAPRRNLTKDTLDLYANAHKWLVIPIIIILVAFTPLYFATFTSEPWGYHMHAMSAIAWYLLMITQPYLATHGRLKDHRKWGMIGMLIAGAVVASALTITPTNVYFGQIGGFPPVFPAAFFYGLVFTETLAIIGFAVSVVMAIIKSRVPDEHATWMLGTVFFGFMPAWLRLSMFPAFAFDIEISTTSALMVSIPIFVAVILTVGYKLGKLMHPMILASTAVTILMISTSYLGGLGWYQEFVTDLMKPMVPWP